jgi:hypothetical protein
MLNFLCSFILGCSAIVGSAELHGDDSFQPRDKHEALAQAYEEQFNQQKERSDRKREKNDFYKKLDKGILAGKIEATLKSTSDSTPLQ